MKNISKTKSRLSVDFLSWQSAEYVNQTFGDELDFEIEELDSIYEPQ